MSAFFTSTLNPVQIQQIQTMIASFPMEDADYFAVYETDGMVRSAAAFIEEDDSTYECFAYTAPEYRSQGMFSTLLELTIDEFPEDTEFLFYTNGNDADCMAVLEALEAELVLEEHMMEIDLSSFSDCSVPCSASSPDLSGTSSSSVSSLPLSMSETVIDGTTTWLYENPNGIVNISVFSSYYYLYGFEIKGLGKEFLLQVLCDLAARNPLPLRLQVSGENIPALSLYKKTGFQITETLSGYLY